MAERLISAKLLDDVTECPICTESYSDPRSLPCVHTFCLKCITQWSGDKLPGDSVDCPLCQTKFTVPVKGIGALPKNIFIAKLLPVKEVPRTTTTDAKLCDWCVADSSLPTHNKNEATMFCVNCKERLCECCGEIHSKTRNSRSHRTVSLDQEFDTLAALSTTFCDLHLDKEVKIYCLDCQEALCVVCSKTQHSGHKSDEISKVASEFKQQISRDISELDFSINTIAKTLRNFQNKRQEIDKQFIKVEKDVIAQADQLKATIEGHKQQLLAELNVMRTGKYKEIENSVSEITQDKAMIESFVKYNDELVKKGSNSDIARQSRDLKVRSTELKQMCAKDCNTVLQDTVVSFEPAEALSKGNTNVVGTISHQARDKLPQQARSVETFNILKQTATTVRSVVEGSSGIKLCPTLTFSLDGDSVEAVCSFNGQLYVSRYSTKHIEVYDTSTFKRQRNISLPGVGDYLSGLAACSTNNCLYVSDWKNDKVYRVNLSTTDATSTTHLSVDSHPRGLSVNKSHNLLVAVGHGIQEYTTKGSLVGEMAVDSWLWQAVESSSGHIAVSQYGEVHGVSVMSVDGRVLKRYGSSTKGSGLRQMNGPRSLAIDSEGFILVADEDNNRILVLNSALTEARELLLPALDKPLVFPRGLCFDESLGRLYVGEFGGQHRVLVFDNVFNVGSLF